MSDRDSFTTEEMQAYWKSEEWTKMKADLFILRGGKCERCGGTLDSTFVPHHLSYVKAVYDQANEQETVHGRMASEGRPTLPRLVGLLPVQDGKRPGQGAAGAASFGVPVV